MVNSVGSSGPVAQQYVQNQHHAAKPQPPAKEAQKPDTVELSPKAAQAAGDVDHDGDRH
jgi:hypothetical protein